MIKLTESSLRDYQRRDVNAIRQAFSRGLKKVLYCLPTGGGKTVVFSYITQTTADRGKRVLILTHRDSLLTQSSRSLVQFGVPHGFIKSGFTPTYAHNVQIASVQSMKSRMHIIEPPDLIIIDECHHSITRLYKLIIEFFALAYILGVTATPVRMDGQGLGEVAGGPFQCMILGPSTAELTDDGYLVRSKVFGPERHIDFSSVEMDGNEYDSAELDKILNRPNITGDVIKQYVQVCPNAPAIVFCCSRSHAQNVAAEFRAAGYRSVSVDSTMDDTFIRESLAGLGTGGVDIITSCDLISEGTDIPVCAAVIMLRKTKSLGLFLQMYGRALRVVYAGGYDTGTREGRLAAIAGSEKPHAYILDHVGNVGFWTEEGYVVNHGWATDPRTWTLEGKKKGRKRAGDIAMVKCKQCTQCFAVHLPAPKCDQCGFVYPIAEVEIKTDDGQLREISPEERLLVSKNKRKEQGRADSLKELELIAEQRGYKKSWAKKVLEGREKTAVKKSAAQAEKDGTIQISIQQTII